MTVSTGDNNSKDTIQARELNEDLHLDQSKTVHAIIDEILSKDSLSSTDYNEMEEIIRQNPLIIELKIHSIFKKVLLIEKLSQNRRNSYEKFMSAIIDICTRLRRNQKIVAWILMALNESLMNIKSIDKIPKTSAYILPQNFIDKFSASISNLTNSQVGNVLNSLAYYVASWVTNSTGENTKPTLTMASKALVIVSEITKQLARAVFEGIDVFEVTRPCLGKEKVINGLKHLGKTVFNFITILKKSHNNDDQIVGLNLCKIVEDLQAIVIFINHHSTGTVTENDWSDVYHNMVNIEEEIMDFEGKTKVAECSFLRQLKERTIQVTSNLCIDLNAVRDTTDKIHSLKEPEKGGVDKDLQTNYGLNYDSISQLAKFLIENFNSISHILIEDSIQNNETLVTALVFEILRKIHMILGESTSTIKKLLNVITTVNWRKNYRYRKTLKSLKAILATPTWTHLNDTNIQNDIMNCVKILLHLPLMYCITDLKTIIFLTILSLKRETLDNATLSTVCEEIIYITSERYKEDLLQYIQPELFILELSKLEKIFSRVMECSLTNSNNYKTLKQALKSHLNNKYTLTMMIECLEKVKLKNPDNMELLKLETKLLPKIMLYIDDEPLNANQLKTLTIAVKAAVALNKFDNVITNRIHRTLAILTGTCDGESNRNNIEFERESFHFIQVILQYKNSVVRLDSRMIKNIWSLLLIKSCSDLVPLLIEASDAEIFSHALNLLTKNTIKSFEQNENENSLENCLIIWTAIAKVDLGRKQERTREISFQTLMRTIKARYTAVNNSMMLNIIKLFISIVSSRQMIITDKTTDLIMTIVNSFMNESLENLIFSQQTLHLCSSWLKFRPALTINYLPVIVGLYLKTIKIIIGVLKKNSENEQLQYLIALEIQKLASAFIKLKKYIGKLSPYIIADMVDIYYGEGVMPSYVKEPLDDSISQFLNICDQHGISLLFRLFSPSLQEIFKKIYDNYIKFNKFSGKV